MSLVPYNVYRIRRPKQLPLPVVPIDITNGVDTPANGGVSPNTPLVGDGSTDDTAALEAIALDTNITNWYFPENKTFRLYRNDIPSHIKAVYGKGTIQAIDRNPGAYGGFYIISQHLTGLVIDGLIFKRDDINVSGEDIIYGMITFNGGNGSSPMNLEIDSEVRNCTFEGLGYKALGVKFIGQSVQGWSKNVSIHDNTFNDVGWFSVELFGSADDGLEDGGGLEDFKVYNNIVNSPVGGEGFSLVGMRRRFDCFNNTIIGGKLGIEIARDMHGYIYNNDVRVNSSNGYAVYLNDDRSRGYDSSVNYIYNNHFEGHWFYVYDGDSSFINNNYIKAILLTNDVSGNSTEYGEYYDNTLVGDWSTPVTLNDVTKINLHDNDIYTTTGTGISANIATSDVILESNNINLTGTGTCINAPGATEIDNICTLDYTGEVPTFRPGAGLLPPEPTHLTINGFEPSCRTILANQRGGANDLRSVKDENGRVIYRITTNLAKFDKSGAYIDTGVNVDGSIHNITIMSSFTYPKEDTLTIQNILYSNGDIGVDNKIGASFSPDGSGGYTAEMIFGKTTFDITTMLDPALNIQAIGMTYDFSTGLFMLGVNGTPLTDMGAVIFDGSTANIWLGNIDDKSQPFTGFMGELSIDTIIATETDWQDYWTSVKDVIIPDTKKRI